LRYRPRAVIYNLIEMVAPYGEQDVELNRYLSPKIDLLIFPEENRARLDIQRCAFGAKPMAVVYNVNDAPAQKVVAPSRRQPRLFYGGAISSDLGMADFLLHPDMASVPLDLFGDVSGPDRAELSERLQSATGERRYHGCVDGKTLARFRRGYAYALVMYRPTQEHTHYAAPNKFFEAIADGVPPIVAPHPQCKTIVERYECGIVMRDWSFEAYRHAVEQAMSLLGTRRYRTMVRNCLRAVRAELNWPAQFAKVRRLLPAA
jgi:glycosyltransferase involved in cell wall biosynthesis